MITFAITLIILISLAGVLFAIDRLALWMERKGWIYWRKVGPKGSMRAGLSVFQEIVQPEIRHVAEERQQRHAENDEQSPSRR